MTPRRADGLGQSVPQHAGRYDHIDALRAVAVMLVVVAHSGLGHIVPGGSGVTIFFTISGFIITHLVIKEWRNTGRFDPLGFYTRRLWKLAPPLLVVIVVPTLIYALFRDLDWGAFASQLFFGYNWVFMSQGEQGLLPGSGVLWSLAIEEQFYLVFAPIAVVAARSAHFLKVLTWVGAVAAIAPLVLRIVITAGGIDEMRTFSGTDTRIDGIAIGVLTALAFDRWGARGDSSLMRRLGSPWALVAACAGYLVSLLIRDDTFRETFRYSLQSVSTAVAVMYGFAARPSAITRAFQAATSWQPVRVIGLASYSIYLAHFVVVHAVEAHVHIDVLHTVAAKVVLGTGVGIAVWLVIERPVLHVRQARARRHAATSQQGAAATA